MITGEKGKARHLPEVAQPSRPAAFPYAAVAVWADGRQETLKCPRLHSVPPGTCGVPHVSKRCSFSLSELATGIWEQSNATYQVLCANKVKRLEPGGSLYELPAVTRFDFCNESVPPWRAQCSVFSSLIRSRLSRPDGRQ